MPNFKEKWKSFDNKILAIWENFNHKINIRATNFAKNDPKGAENVQTGLYGSGALFGTISVCTGQLGALLLTAGLFWGAQKIKKARRGQLIKNTNQNIR